MILAGDLGATKIKLAFLNDNKKIINSEKFKSADYHGLEEVVDVFRTKYRLKKISKAVIAVAGPVVNGNSKLTNLPWELNEKKLQNDLNITKVKLLNDLNALACYIPSILKKDVYPIKGGKCNPRGNVAIIAPGTGLGEAFLAWNGSEYKAYASEGGHADFAPSSEIEIELLKYLFKKYKKVNFEMVCSGLGIPNIYAFLKEMKFAAEPAWLRNNLKQCKDPTPIIINTAKSSGRRCKICTWTVDLYLSILSSEAGNLALKTLATGGVYIGGGITPRLIKQINKGVFTKTFQYKRGMEDLLADIPINLILNTDSVLLGAANSI